jgi:tetratricopeptide (TPR) repeat protein
MTSTARRSSRDDSPLVDLDALSALEDERDFLLRSLDDLEREHDAGDVDDTDYTTLRDDYTARAAAVIRQIDAKRAAAEPPRARRSWGRTLGWVAAIAVFAVLAGVLVARMSGSRRDNETATGDVRDSTRQLLAEGAIAFQRGELDDAIERYSAALELSPSSAEALAYRGWARFNKGDEDDGAFADLDAAIAMDPAYPDPHVFKAVALAQTGDFVGAYAETKLFDALDPPSTMQQIISDSSLREKIVVGTLLTDGAPSYADAGFTAEQLVAAAKFSADGKNPPAPADAIKLLDLVLATEPDNADAHAYKGFTLARVGDQAEDRSVIDSGLADIDAALAVDPQHAPALAYRAFTRMFLYDDPAGAKQSLDAFDALAEKPDDIVALVDGYSLREDITAALQN